MGSETRPFWVNRWYLIYILIALTILFMWTYATFILHICVVSGQSMEPTFYENDILQCRVDYSAEDIKRGDVVVIKNQKSKAAQILNLNLIVKRVIGLPGDELCASNGQIYIQKGDKYELTGYEYEPMENAGILPEMGDTTLHLSEDEYFCVGDNRNNSVDSRKYGPFKYNQIERIVIGPITLK